MKPIVHGLQHQYGGKLDVLYFDVSEAKNAPLMRKLGYKSTPHLMLLTKKGRRVDAWTGVTPEATLRSAIDRLLQGR
jgi:thioredoxin-like negative regulator of GroEL